MTGYIDNQLVGEGMVVTPGTRLVMILVGRYVMTEVGDLAGSGCDGRWLPTGCSGLAVISRFPFQEVEFHPYSDHGNIFVSDGEYWAGKGVGRGRIEPDTNRTVDVFVTHTAASDYNYYYRGKQVEELVGHVERSDADFVILGGDFNVDPRMNETSYRDLEKAMVNSVEEFFIRLADWLFNKDRATYGNPGNTYSNNDDPVVYDYIFHKANGRNTILTDFFNVPLLKMSLSDHEAVQAHLVLWK